MQYNLEAIFRYDYLPTYLPHKSPTFSNKNLLVFFNKNETSNYKGEKSMQSIKTKMDEFILNFQSTSQ